MKRTILNGLLLLGALLVGGACQNEMELGAPVLDADSFNIVTRAEGDVPEGTIAGDDANNENTVRTARVYFFPANQAETATSVYKCTVSAAADGKTLSVKVESDMYDKSYDIYVVANAPANVNWPDGHATLAELKALQMVTAWKEGGEEALLMDGVLPNQQVVRGGSATVDLTRAMAKVTLKVTAKEITDGDVTYTPDFAHMSVTLVNAATKTQLDGNYRPTGGDYTGVTQEYEANEEGAYVHAPLYSYPNPEAGATAERQNAYLQLRLPWLMEDGTGQQAGNYYYTIPITANHVANMERNHYYDVSVDVKVLGSLDPNDMVELTPNIFIRDWFNMQLSSSIDKFQYLVLEEDSTTLYNVTDYANPYVSSSEIDSYKILSVEYVDYSSVDFSDVTMTTEYPRGHVSGEEGYWGKYDNFSNYTCKIDPENETITFSHEIDTDIMFAKRVITIEVTNKEGISRTWVITQYPEMYIEGERNQSRGGHNRFVYGVSETESDGESTVRNDSGNSLGGVYGYDNGGTNNNPNQYTIYVTANSPYAIGDPRSSTSVSAESLNISQKEDYTKNKLKTYYPTRGREVANMIAPAFKIASSWGKTLDISFARAKERCASYQENGYPAGRWRVPTEAEIAYVISLSEDKKIPKLFDEGYWCSSGTVYGSSDNAAAVRCVYDVWYWGEGKEGDAANNYERFYWGSQTPSSN